MIPNYILTLNLVKEKTLNIQLQNQAFYIDKKNSQKNLHIFKDGASECASGNIEQMVVILFIFV